jgi:hypothetical protein
LKEKVDMLAKRATSKAGKLNNYDLKVMIQWLKCDGDKAMPNNKEGLLLCYRETHTCVLYNGGTYPHEDVAVMVADCQVENYRSASRSHTATATADSQDDPTNFDLEDAGSQAAAYVSPTRVSTSTAADSIVVATPTAVATPTPTATTTAATVAIIIDYAVLTHDEATTDALMSDCQPNDPPLD